MVPRPVVDFILRCFDLDGTRAHVQEQVQTPVQQLHCEKVHLGVLLAPGGLSVLRLAVSEQDQAVGLRGAEVERDGAHALGVPLGKADVGLRRLERDGVQSGHVLALKHNISLDLHLRVHDARQA